jgi:hypothetical protein
VLLRSARPGDAARGERRLTRPRRLSLDAAVVPGLLLLIARDLALFDPPRVLAWRLLHDTRLADVPAWLGPLLPSPSGALDRDPVALLLASLATLLALAYAALALGGARPSRRAAVVVVAAMVLIVLPSAAFIGMGAATDRPWGQDGGVVQLPLALEMILGGHSPYGADYSGTVLAQQARVSSFWQEYGQNPILHHHAYLPGTHLLMMPFFLASRALLGAFDPRLVTLLFYALTVVLAARLPFSDEGRLAAAGVAALNPLVYWHQIFGANDLVLVALVLAAVLAARAERPLAAGALLGLACATKQLAWPFAPFLLLALSGARGVSDLRAPATWRRLLGPAAVAAVVFAVVVLPVAALDFRAFWGDIVVYNVGLPGADNYPLGGTPGFGFANYLIYFGQVSSLREHVSFSRFYLLLVPLGLLLAHRQMREGRPEAALATGSVALVASVYFSRVVHPNYLIPAAVLLPVGVLARPWNGRRRADLALVPLLLFGLAVDVAEHAVLRAAWEQAAAADLPARLGGIAAALAPRAGPTLTRDPLGLLWSASAAGLAILYLVVAIADAGRGVRRALVAVAAVLVVAVPLLVVVTVGDRTGLFRTQDPAPVQAAADGRRLLAARSPYTPPPDEMPRGREAFAVSFRAEPPIELTPDHPLMPPAPGVVAALERAMGCRDIRLPALLALALLAVLAARRFPGLPSVPAVLLLATPLGLGLVLGSPLALPLLALAGAWLAAAGGRVRTAGLLAGLALALDWRSALLAPLLVAPPRSAPEPGPRPLPRAAAWGALAWGAVTLPVLALDPSSFLARLLSLPRPGAGLGLFNVLAYYGVEASAGALALAALVPAMAVVVAVGLVRRWAPPLAGAAVAALLWLVLAPGAPPDAVALPQAFLVLAAAEGGGEPEVEQTAAA